jgi:hypothetical protein
MRMTIAVRLALGTGIMLTLILGQAGFTGYVAHQSGKTAQTLKEISSDLQAGDLVAKSALTTRLAVKEFVIDHSKERSDMVRQRANETQQAIEECKASFSNPERVALVNDLQTIWGEYQRAFDQVDDQLMDVEETTRDRMNPAAAKLAEGINAALLKAVAAREVKSAESLTVATAALGSMRAGVLRFLATSDEAFAKNFAEREAEARKVLAATPGSESLVADLDAYTAAATSVLDSNRSALATIHNELDPRGAPAVGTDRQDPGVAGAQQR